MAHQIFTLPKQTNFNSSADLLSGAKAYFYLTGTSTPTSVYADSALTTPLSNPVVADAAGVFTQIFMDPFIVYRMVLKTFAGVELYAADPANEQLLSQALIGQYLYPRTDAEIAADVTPVNYAYPSEDVRRYGAKADASEDASDAVQATVDVALAAIGDGKAGAGVYFPYGAYLLTTPPSFGAASAHIRPIEIYGDGWGSQIINNAAPNTAATFDMEGVCGWRIRDLVLCGNSAHKNDGIKVNSIGGPSSIMWRISNVLALMPGYGIYMADTNTGVIDSFISWPGNTAGLLRVEQTVTLTDILHHIYLRGAFCHNISVYDAWCMPNVNYSSGQRGLICDASQCHGLSIVGGLFQASSGINTETGIDLDGNVIGALIQGVYHEGTVIRLGNVTNSRFCALVDGGIDGTLLLNGSTQDNTLDSVFLEAVQLVGSGVVRNQFTNVRCTDFTNNGQTSNRYVSCLMGGDFQFDWGGTKYKELTYGTAISIDCYDGNVFRVNVSDGAGFAINAPDHPVAGHEITIEIRNAFGSMGAITWNAVFKKDTWTNPANGFNRSIRYFYDGTNWIQCNDPLSIPN